MHSVGLTMSFSDQIMWAQINKKYRIPVCYRRPLFDLAINIDSNFIKFIMPVLSESINYRSIQLYLDDQLSKLALWLVL